MKEYLRYLQLKVNAYATSKSTGKSEFTTSGNYSRIQWMLTKSDKSSITGIRMIMNHDDFNDKNDEHMERRSYTYFISSAFVFARPRSILTTYKACNCCK